MSKHLDDKLIDYAWDMLTSQERAEAEAHLRDCADCRAEMAGHQALVQRLAATIPAALPAAPPRVRAGWPQVMARLPHLRAASAPRQRGAPGLVGLGLALSTAALLAIVVMAQAWPGLSQSRLTATALYASYTPTASVTHYPERPTALSTPGGALHSDGPIATLPVVNPPQPPLRPIATPASP
jgi:anti-sigma factor RsiW